MVTDVLNMLLYLDKTIFTLVETYGPLIYALLFSVIFIETGLVVAPFLPGDTLLFAAGTLAGAGKLNFFLLFFLLTAAAIAGDAVNYFIGKKFGHYILRKGWLKEKNYLRAKKYYKIHGGKTIVFARFLPLIRSVAPFVAGIGDMDKKRFFSYNIFGGTLWVFLFLLAGYLFGNLEFVKNNFTIIIIVIAIASIVLPFALEWVNSRRQTKKKEFNFKFKRKVYKYKFY